MIKKILKIFNNLYIKNRKNIIFSSFPDYSGNAKALYDFLSQDKFYNTMWILNQKGLQKGFYKKSFNGLIKIFSSKYIFTTHNSFIRIKSKKQIYINLWHGMPLKKMSYMENNFNEKDISYNINNTDIMISTSVLTKSLLSSCFNIKANKIYITGQPRNDYLFIKRDKSKSNLEKVLNMKINKEKKIIFYLPTFREGYLNRSEGKKIENFNIFRFDSFNIREFIKFLEVNEILFIMKLHPFEEKYYKNILKDYKTENLKIIQQEKLTENYLDLYEVLGYSDLLITDYSSVYFDYLLIDKPVIFVPTDIEEYSQKRGFLLEPYDFWTPGPKVYNQDDLLNSILANLNEPNKYKKERNLINSMINYYKDNKSSERVWNLIKERYE